MTMKRALRAMALEASTGARYKSMQVTAYGKATGCLHIPQEQGVVSGAENVRVQCAVMRPMGRVLCATGNVETSVETHFIKITLAFRKKNR